ncbi:hypothetical protein RM549_10720 [Salegentibacter sp. F188]|uniref:Acyl-CoA dehydrogenase n=1 Tax=Autumnicola patrickiae TaxID=3075591 RepID=A0ABU3E2N8_9FLAO|nr:hypothetical protein [Salegentibacter sp. F188]MDT0690259.1 hypothetical protein [Salegentibacter sp. F188]
MWEQAIEAIKASDKKWIKENQQAFSAYFRNENEKPQGKLIPEALAAHYHAGLFKMFLSKSYNGLALPLPEGSKWIENAAALDGNWGWLLAIGVGGAYFADYMQPETARKYFCPKEALVAGSGKPVGEALKINGDKYQVSGKWSYCSGSEQASMYTGVTKKDGEISAFVVPPKMANIDPDWNTVGLPLTCSHSVILQDVEIPSSDFFDLMEKPRKSEYPLASYPFVLFARACFVPVVCGISDSVWNSVSELLKAKKELWQQFQPGRYEFIEKKCREFSEKKSALTEAFYQKLKESWQNHLDRKDPLEKEVSSIGLQLSEFCYQSVAGIIPKLGMKVLENGEPLQEKWQNLQTAYQHMSFHEY